MTDVLVSITKADEADRLQQASWPERYFTVRNRSGRETRMSDYTYGIYADLIRQHMAMTKACAIGCGLLLMAGALAPAGWWSYAAMLVGLVGGSLSLHRVLDYWNGTVGSPMSTVMLQRTSRRVHEEVACGEIVISGYVPHGDYADICDTIGRRRRGRR